MAERDEPREPDPDNWFDEPDVTDAWDARADRLARTRRPRATPEADDWLAATAAPSRARSPAARRRIGVAAVAGAAVALLLILLAASGVFSSGGRPSGVPTTTAGPRTRPAPARRPQPAAPAVPAGTLKPGASGAGVRELQRALRRLGYDAGSIDGRYGPSTEGAVKRFQQAHALVVDGIAGNATLAALRKALTKNGG